jgi:hypothetical protein
MQPRKPSIAAANFQVKKDLYQSTIICQINFDLILQVVVSKFVRDVHFLKRFLSLL